MSNSNQFLTPHFKLSEMLASRKAVEHGIQNVPGQEAVENLRKLCENTLEPLRVALGVPIHVTSGFRTRALNDLLAHSSDRSQQMAGQAADFYVGDGTRQELVKAFHQILVDPNISFDQLILYPSFIHVSYVSKEKNRRGILKAQGNGKLGYGRLTLANALAINF